MKRLRLNVLWPLFVSVFIFLIHFYDFGFIPPDFHGGVFWDRVSTAIVSILTVITVFLVVQKISHQTLLCYLTILFFSIMPWHIEQSRIVSPVIWGSLWYTCMIYTILKIKNIVAKSILLGIFILLLPTAYPRLWVFDLNNDHIVWSHFLKNLFILTSPDFLFFENKAFEIGSLKIYGVMLWETIPFFLIGGIVLLQSLTKFQRALVASWILLPLLFASLNPVFTGMEFYLATPALALIQAIGSLWLIEYMRKSPLLGKVLIGAYSIFFLYALANFGHYYFTHYSQRIMKEPNHAHKRF